MYKSSPFPLSWSKLRPLFVKLSPRTSRNRHLCPSTLYLPPIRVSTFETQSLWPCLCRGRFFPSLRESKSRVNELTRSHVVLSRAVYNMSSNWNKSETDWTPKKNYLPPLGLPLVSEPAWVFNIIQLTLRLQECSTAFTYLSLCCTVLSSPSLSLPSPSSSLFCT